MNIAKVSMKRQRTENWLEEDKFLLTKLVKERVHAIENKNTDTNTNKKKLAAWTGLQLKFNAMCKGARRTIAQLKSQWGIIKFAAKKSRAAEKKSVFKTGGDPPPPSGQDSSEDIANWLPNKFIIDDNEFDSDSNPNSQISIDAPQPNTSQAVDVLVESKTSQATKEDKISITCQDDVDKSILADNVCAEIQSSDTSQQVHQEFEPEARNTMKRKKQKSPPPKASEMQRSISAITEMETKCRRELHEIQMENEKRKARNLDLKYEILQEKLKFYR